MSLRRATLTLRRVNGSLGTCPQASKRSWTCTSPQRGDPMLGLDDALGEGAGRGDSFADFLLLQGTGAVPATVNLLRNLLLSAGSVFLGAEPHAGTAAAEQPCRAYLGHSPGQGQDALQ